MRSIAHEQRDDKGWVLNSRHRFEIVPRKYEGPGIVAQDQETGVRLGFVFGRSAWKGPKSELSLGLLSKLTGIWVRTARPEILVRRTINLYRLNQLQGRL